MRKSLLFVLVAVIVLLGAATGVLFSKYKKSTADYADMQAAEEAARNRYAQTIDAIAEIQDTLNAIALGDGSVQMKSGGLQAEQQISPPTGQEAMDRIAQVRASIERSKLRIRQLESALKKSGIKATGLEKMVANLKQSVADKEQLVTELSTRVDTLQTQVAGLQTEVQVNTATIEDKRRELATVYVAVGTKKDLTESGVLEAKGGVLGMGKTLKPTGKFDEMTFTPLDTDQQTVVAIQAPKAFVVSAQPPTSYEIREVEKGRLELHIINPTEFRKVRQLVIVTA
jgi:predicted  nucleic acid-binding Zn-ribbon protein